MFGISNSQDSKTPSKKKGRSVAAQAFANRVGVRNSNAIAREPKRQRDRHQHRPRDVHLCRLELLLDNLAIKARCLVRDIRRGNSRAHGIAGSQIGDPMTRGPAADLNGLMSVRANTPDERHARDGTGVQQQENQQPDDAAMPTHHVRLGLVCIEMILGQSGARCPLQQEPKGPRGYHCDSGGWPIHERHQGDSTSSKSPRAPLTVTYVKPNRRMWSRT